MRSSFFYFSWLLLFAVLTTLGGSYSVLNAVSPNSPFQTMNQISLINEFQEPTPAPEITAETSDIDLPTARNPGLVFGAVILMLIIIGGVIINSRFFKKK